MRNWCCVAIYALLVLNLIYPLQMYLSFSYLLVLLLNYCFMQCFYLWLIRVVYCDADNGVD